MIIQITIYNNIICNDTEYEDVPPENNNNAYAWMQVSSGH